MQNEVYARRKDQLRASIATDVEEAFELVQVNCRDCRWRGSRRRSSTSSSR